MGSTSRLRTTTLALLLATGLYACQGGAETNESGPTPSAIRNSQDALLKAQVVASAQGRLIAGRKPRVVEKQDQWQVRFTSPGGRALDGSRDFTVTLDARTGTPLTIIDHANR